MNNPFDLENYKRQITMHKENTLLKTSYQQTAYINKERARGKEPSISYSDKAPTNEPEKFVTEMPVMKKYVRPSRRKKVTATPELPVANDFTKTDSTGMTMRDHFAKYAMQAVIADYHGKDWQSRARDAYNIADAMLEQRAR